MWRRLFPNLAKLDGGQIMMLPVLGMVLFVYVAAKAVEYGEQNGLAYGARKAEREKGCNPDFIGCEMSDEAE